MLNNTFKITKNQIKLYKTRVKELSIDIDI